MRKVLIDMADNDYHLEHLKRVVDPIGPSCWISNEYIFNPNHHLVDIIMLNEIAVAISTHCDWLKGIDRKVCQLQIMSDFLYLIQTKDSDHYSITRTDYCIYCRRIFGTYSIEVKIRQQ